MRVGFLQLIIGDEHTFDEKCIGYCYVPMRVDFFGMMKGY